MLNKTFSNCVTFIYGCNNKSLGVGLMLCPFSRITVVGSLVGFITCLDIDSSSSNAAKYGFHFIHSTLNPIRKQFVTSMTFMPLLHHWACLARLVIILAHRIHS